MDYGNLKVSLKNGKNKKYTLINLFEENELKMFFGDKILVLKKQGALGIEKLIING